MLALGIYNQNYFIIERVTTAKEVKVEEKMSDTLDKLEKQDKLDKDDKQEKLDGKPPTPTPTPTPEEIREPIYSIYRVSTNGDPQIVIQAEGCCMLDHAGIMTKETMRTVQSKMGPTVARAIFAGKNLHFHVDLSELQMKKQQEINLQANRNKPAPSSGENGDTEKKTDEK